LKPRQQYVNNAQSTAEKDNIVNVAHSISRLGGIVFSALLLIVGLILTNQKNFAKNYVRDQLASIGPLVTAANKAVTDAKTAGQPGVPKDTHRRDQAPLSVRAVWRIFEP
jgi:hypothetical protein